VRTFQTFGPSPVDSRRYKFGTGKPVPYRK
jgi:hypothetical protein